MVERAASDLGQADETEALATFRAKVRAWIADNMPAEMVGADPLLYQTVGHEAQDESYQLWRRRVGEKGWGVPTWPVRYGGAGLSQEEAAVIAEELTRARGFNPIRSYGTMMLGPTLLEFGTEEQKLRYLRPMARFDVRWCQGFSEPGAGSDLAALRMSCVDMGDAWLVNGQKIWTSGADHADWCFALVRTDTSRKHEGISFLLIDMATPGVEARPIVLISGSTHFCEVFFNDVRVPKENLVGEVNQGWSVAKRLLQFERDSLSVGRGSMPSLAPIAREVIGIDAAGRIADPDLRARLIRNGMRLTSFSQMLAGLREQREAGQGPNAAISTVKNLWSDLMQERAELLVEIYGSDGLGWSGDGYGEEQRAATRAWLHSKAYSIYGGSFEVQANIVAKRVLGLPSA